MKFRLFGRSWEIKNSTSALPSLGNDAAWAAYLTGKGYPVTAMTALKVSAVLRCVDVVAKTMASLPMNLFVKTSTGQVKAGGHPIYKLLNRLPNSETTAYSFWHMLIFNLMLTRGGYAKIVRDRAMIIRELWNIPTSNVEMHRNSVNGERYIDVRLPGVKDPERLHEGEFLFIPGLRFGDADSPEDPIRIASEVLGLTKALSGFATDFFENGSNIGGFISNGSTLLSSNPAYKNFQDSWNATYSGIKNSHKVAILADGMVFNQLGAKLNDSQALESRQFAVIEICRMFGVPPHLVYEMDRATYSNIEQMNIQYTQDCVSPMAVRIEQTIYKDLLTTAEQNYYFAKLNLNGLLRGDTLTRTGYYNVMRQNGIMSANMILALEDENAIPAAEGGDALLVNGNMISLKSAMDNLPKSLQGKGGN